MPAAGAIGPIKENSLNYLSTCWFCGSSGPATAAAAASSSPAANVPFWGTPTHRASHAASTTFGDGAWAPCHHEAATSKMAATPHQT